MKYHVLNSSDAYAKKRREHKNRQRIVIFLATLVVFCTTYAMILPAVTLEKPERVLDCPLSIHQHTADCYDENSELVCGQADFVVHVHNEACIDAEGNLVCPLPQIEAHEHTADCYEMRQIQVCGLEENAGHEHSENCYTKVQGALHCADESEDHVHGDGCYDWEDVLCCGKTEGEGVHTHTDACYQTEEVLTCELLAVLHKHSEHCRDSQGNLICGQLEVLEHTHENGCFAVEENSDAETPPEESESTETVLTAPYGAVVSAWAEVGEPVAATYSNAPLRAPADAAPADETPTDLAPHLTDAKILVDGKEYVSGDQLDKDASFSVVLDCGMANNALSYQYSLPDQIVVQDTGSAQTPLELYAGDTKIATYYIKDNIIHINYEQSYTTVTTELTLSASWNQNVSNHETINWGNDIKTEVDFIAKDIIIKKEDSNKGVMAVGEDGCLYIEYTIQASLEEGGELTIRDALSDNAGGITKLWKDAYNGSSDYEIKIYDSETKAQVGESQYGNFSGTDDTSFSIGNISLEKGQYAEIKYKVKVDETDRTALEISQKKLEVSNKATAESKVGDKTLTADVTHNVTYQAPKSWIQKTATNTDGNSNADDTWRITINGQNKYDVEGTAVMDHLSGSGTTYQTDEDAFSVTIAGQDGTSTKQTLKVIDITDWKINGVSADEFENFIAELSTYKSIEEMNGALQDSVAQRVLKELLGTQETVDVARLSQYVFVDNSERTKDITKDTGPLFLWIAPPNSAVQGAGDAPYSYTLDYSTKSEDGTTAVINQAMAHWHDYPVGTGPVTTSRRQVRIDKSNSGVQTDEHGELYVDWTIQVTVPENSAELKDIWLIDSLPEADVTVSKNPYKAYPSLANLSSETLDGAFLIQHESEFTSGQPFDKNNDLVKYLHGLVEKTFTFTYEGDGAAKGVAENAYPFLGAFGYSLANNFQTYEGLASRLGTMDLTGWSEGSRVSPKMFSIYLGDLPATENGYTITVTYRTKVNPYTKPLATQDYVEGTNRVELYADLGSGNYAELGAAESSYWLAKQLSEDSVIKNIKDYDPTNRILTYRVALNPQDNLQVGQLSYQLHDSLDRCPGATYIADSFKLYIRGTAMNAGTENQAWVYDPNAENLAWSSDPDDFNQSDENDFWKRLYEYIETPFTHGDTTYQRLDLDVSNFNGNERNSYFQLTLNNDAWIGTGTAKFVPMILEYQVQLPEDVTEATRYIDNEVRFTAYEVENPSKEALLGASRTSYDTQNIMHKKLYQQPSIQNNYTAGFQIEINRYGSTKLVDAKEIKVKDTLSDTLSLIVSSVTLEGKSQNADEAAWTPIPSSGWRLVQEANTFEVTIITDTDKPGEGNAVYDQYRLTYRAKVLGDPETLVHYSNSASIESLGITSETVEQNVFIQESSGSGSITNLSFTLLKVDGRDMTQRLDGVVFDLYTYSAESGRWIKQNTDSLLTTNEEGKIELVNGQNGVSLNYDTWYALKETRAKAGYLLADPVYFYIPKGSDKPAEPTEGVNKETFVGWEKINSEGELSITNVTPGFTLEKQDASTGKPIGKTVEFTLYLNYSNGGCSDLVRRLENSTDGIFEFDNLSVNTTYYLKETKVPEGYLDTGAVYQVTIDNQGKVTIQRVDGNGDSEIVPHKTLSFRFIAKNTPTAHELPQTGGFGTAPYTIGGSLLTGAGLLLLYNKKRRRKEDLASS